jgi:hypothetical protein
MYTRTGLLFFLVSVLQCAAAASAVSEVDHLIAYVDQSGCAFIRNGSPADSHAAAAHLRQKQRFANGRVKTAEQFIEHIASGSSMSGKPYLVECPGETAQESGPWLSKELQHFRAESK